MSNLMTAFDKKNALRPASINNSPNRVGLIGILLIFPEIYDNSGQKL